MKSKKSMAKQTAPRFVPFGEAFKNYFEGYVTWSGRATRAEYWWMFLFTVVASYIMRLTPTIISIAWSVVFFLPTISIIIRRLHDTGRSGYWYLWIAITFLAGFALMLIGGSAKILFFGVSGIALFFASAITLTVLLALPSTPGKNKYGNIRK
jgi:uncharacterized membrane protein YhaH (DUF805 family)